MKRKRILSVFILALLMIPLTVGCFFLVGCGDTSAETEVNGIVYLFDETKDEYTVMEYIGESEEVVIEPEVNGKAVTSIAEKAFNNYYVSSVKVPSSVVRIAEGAFRGCSNLVNLELPYIGSDSEAVGENAMLGYIFGQKSFANSYSSKQYYATDRFAMYYLPLSLKSVTVTDGKNIAAGAVSGIKTVETFNMPNVTTIGERAFKGCAALSSVSIESNITAVGLNAFEGCEKLSLVFIKSATVAAGMTDENSMGSVCKNASTIFISSTIETVGEYFLSGFKKVENRMVDNISYSLYGIEKIFRFELEHGKLDGGIASNEFVDASGGYMVGGMNESVDSSVELTINALIDEEVEIFFCMGGHANFLFKDMFKTELNGAVAEVDPEARFTASGWNDWKRFSIGKFNFKEGLNTIKFTVIRNETNPRGQCGNLDYIDVKSISSLS